MKYNDEYVKEVENALLFFELPLTKKITKNDINVRYKLLSKKYHPDVAKEQSNANELFIKLTNTRDFLLKDIDSVNDCIINIFSSNQIIKSENNNKKDTIVSTIKKANTGYFVFLIISYIILLFEFVVSLGFAVMNLKINTAPTVLVLEVLNLIAVLSSIYYLSTKNDGFIYNLLLIIICVINVLATICVGIGAYSGNYPNEQNRFYSVLALGILCVVSLIADILICKKEH